MDVFNLQARLGLNTTDYTNSLNGAESTTAKVMKSIGSAVATFSKVSAAAFAAAGSAAVVLAKKAVDSYADYEQLVGGVETLFGTQSMSLEEYAEKVGKTVDDVAEKYASLEAAQETVLNNASIAYKSAGLSANAYMEQVTSFAAALTSSLQGDTEAAANAADMAIIDMADNANKMGSSMESIQNAYNGFAKQNYTMLDNLKLGYGGTKEEMQRLLEDAEKLPSAMGQKFDVSNFNDIVTAIHLVQDNMGITGTTSKEAAETISGSIGMMKSAWDNLVTGLARDDADIESLIDNMVQSLTISAQNIIPRFSIALNGIAQLVKEIAPVLAVELPGLIDDFLPNLLEAARSLVTALVENLPEILQPILDELPVLIDMIVELIPTLMDALNEVLPELLDATLEVITQLIVGISEQLPTLVPQIVEIILGIVNVIIENAPLIINAAIVLMQGLTDGLLQAMPIIIEALPELVRGICDALTSNMPLVVEAYKQIMLCLIDALPDIIEGLSDCMPEIIHSFVDAAFELQPLMWEAWWELFTAFIKQLPLIIAEILVAVADIIGSIFAEFYIQGEEMGEKGAEFFEKLLARIGEIKDYIKEKVFAIVASIISNLKDKWEDVKEAGYNLLIKIVDRIAKLRADIKEKIWEIVLGIEEKLREGFEKIKDVGKYLVDGLWEGIKGAWDGLKSNFTGLIGGLIDGAKDKLGIKSPSRVFMQIGEYMAEGLGIGWENEFSDIKDQIEDDLEFSAQPLDVNASGTSAGQVVYNQTVNINDKIASADEIAEKLRIESRYGLMVGGASFA